MDSPRNRELHRKRWTPLLDRTVAQILVRNMLRLLLPPTQKSELLFKFENKYLKK